MSEGAAENPSAVPPPPEEPKMEIHKPKPVHNLREFLTELVVVVLGVSIALAAEQTVEWLHWRAQVQEARGILASEMANNLASAAARLGTQACIERRLDVLGSILDQASRSGSLPPVGDIGTAPRRNWSSGAWESLVASQTATHFPRAELAKLAVNYYFLQRLTGYAPQEQEAWYQLAAIVGPGRRLDPASDAALRNALSLARGYSHSIASLSNNLVTDANLHNLPFSPADLDLIAAARRDATRDSAGNGVPVLAVCQPMGAPPAQYGQAGGALSPQTIANSLTLLPGAPAP